MENRFITMFGFTLKKEYILNKIKEHLNYTEELDFSNLPESFKDVIENHFSIECLNAFVPHLILRSLRLKLFQLNPELESQKMIHMVCKPSGELYIGFVKKEDIIQPNDYHNVFDYEISFNQNISTTLLEELKEFIGFENILEDISDRTVGIYHDIDNKGIKFLFEILYQF